MLKNYRYRTKPKRWEPPPKRWRSAGFYGADAEDLDERRKAPAEEGGEEGRDLRLLDTFDCGT